MTDWLPALTFFGLHVDCGYWHNDRRVWLRYPVAHFTCRYGCEATAVGAPAVIAFTARIATDHARICPGSAHTAQK